MIYEVVCVHRWSEPMTVGRHCPWCETWWMHETPEPRVVVSRLEPAADKITDLDPALA